MKKTMKLTLLVCITLLTCAMIFTACDSNNETPTTNESSGTSVEETNGTLLEETNDTSLEETNGTSLEETNTSVEHQHEYNVQSATSKYLHSESTCTSPSQYYYSCSCGEKSNNLFSYGHPRYHNLSDGICTTCGINYKTHYEIAIEQENERYLEALNELQILIDGLADRQQRLNDNLISLGVSYLKPAYEYTNEQYMIQQSIYDKTTEMNYAKMAGDLLKANQLSLEIDALSDELTKCARCYAYALESEQIEQSYENLEISIGKEELKHLDLISNIDSEYEQINKMYSDGHLNTSNEWVVTTAPTCITEGQLSYKCDYCDYSLIKSINSLGHDLLEADCTSGSKCRKCEYSLNNALGHNWVDATCNMPKTCDRCGKTEGDILGHDLIECEAKEYTCTENGWEAYQKCNRCDYTTYEEIVTPGHICESGWTIITEPTYYKVGLRSGMCTICGEVTEEIPTLPSSEGLSFSYDDVLGGYCCSGIGTCKDAKIVIPALYNNSPVIGIDRDAFKDQLQIVEIVLPSSVTSIGYEAFRGCTNLEVLTLPFVRKGDSMESFIDYFFFYSYGSTLSGQHNIKKIIISEGVTEIPEDAFNGLSSLTEIVIPNTVTSIREGAFDGCTSLEGVYITDMSAWCNISFYIDEYWGNVTTSNPLSNGADLYLNDELVTQAIISDDISATFDGAVNITQVVIADNVTNIGIAALQGCDGITELIIPNGVTVIDIAAFAGCSNLTNVTIPQSVTDIRNQAFASCSKLTSINYTGTISQWNAISKHSWWDTYSGNYTVHCTDGDITK